MGNFVFDNFMGSVFKSLVVVFSAVNATKTAVNALFVVAWLGF